MVRGAALVATISCAACGRLGYERVQVDPDAGGVGGSVPTRAGSLGNGSSSEESNPAETNATRTDASGAVGETHSGLTETNLDGSSSATEGSIHPDTDLKTSASTLSDSTETPALDASLGYPDVDSSLDAGVPSDVTNRSSEPPLAPVTSSEPSDEASDVSTGSACADGLRNCGGACAPCPCSWGTPERLGTPNYAGNGLYSPTLSSDELTLWFGLILAGGPERVAHATRNTVTASFGQVTLDSAPVASNSWEGNPHLSHDGRSLYFYSARSNQDLGLFQATRGSTTGAFNQVVELTTLNSTSTEQLPWVTADELTIYFISDRAGSRDIWTASRAQRTDEFAAPTPVVELNSDGDDGKLTLSPDGLVAIFASDRPGGVGGLDFYRAARRTTNEPFEAPTLISELSTPQADYDPELTRSGDTLYFASQRSGSDSAIWRVGMTCP